MVEVDGKLVRACATKVSAGMSVSTKSAKAVAAQQEAFDQILGNHLLYCTVCDNNNGNCTIHNTTKLMAVEHQKIPAIFGVRQWYWHIARRRQRPFSKSKHNLLHYHCLTPKFARCTLEKGLTHSMVR